MPIAKVKPDTEPKSVTILGSTGSIGCSTIDLIERDREGFDVVALTANKNVESLIQQAQRLRPQLAVVADKEQYPTLKDGLSGSGVEILAGAEGVIEAACRTAEFVMAGIVGAAGLEPTLAAIKRGAAVGLANKESLVCAGELVLNELGQSGATILPVDSEHNAIFQVFDFEHPEKIDKIILTASGGPFLERTLADIAEVTPEEAVAHPNWDMGAKISVDSATMMNKGLELIEAFHLFPVGEPQIEILVHPQSIIHSMVAYVDGSVLAQLGTPDMRTPIAYALAWPQRMAVPAKKLDLAEIGKLTFHAPDEVRFPALRLARYALREGGTAPTVLNAANEVAVYKFLERKIGFLDIIRVVEETLDVTPHGPPKGLSDVMNVDIEARRYAEEISDKLSTH